ncbi:hypothetical protein BDV96DRAFT_602989 [Lophiotrema nucula]|uniref:Uncharacterized protein n=1 Tax=Lophiotrema nucula TaxID=690887 RepID=A0A6A5YW92_9PLEO|nr:hypothetical protein BDV96DRAFT_602989 [Lophiotrema nucula]
MSYPYPGSLPTQFQRRPLIAEPPPSVPSMQPFASLDPPITFTPPSSPHDCIPAGYRFNAIERDASRDLRVYMPAPNETLTSSANPYHLDHADRYRQKLKFPDRALVHSRPVYNRLEALRRAEDSLSQPWQSFRPTNLRGAPRFLPGSKDDNSEELIESIQDALQYTRSKFDKGERPMRVAQFFVYPKAHSMAKEALDILQEGEAMGCANQLKRFHLTDNPIVYEIGVPEDWNPEKKKRARVGKMYDQLGFAVPFLETSEGQLMAEEIQAERKDDPFNGENSSDAEFDDQDDGISPKHTSQPRTSLTQNLNRLEGLPLPDDDGKPLVRRSLRVSTIAKRVSPIGYAELDDEEEKLRRSKRKLADTADGEGSYDEPRKRRGRSPKNASKLTSTKRVTRSLRQEWEDDGEALTVDLSDIDDEDGEFKKKRRSTRGAKKSRKSKHVEDWEDDGKTGGGAMTPREPRQARGAKVNYALNDGEEVDPFDNEGEDDEFGDGDGGESDED